MKRILAITLIMAFILIGAGCAGETEETFTKDFDNGNDSIIDFGGQHLKILTSWVDEWHPEVGFTAMGDHLLERYKEMEDNYNIIIDFFKPVGSAEAYVISNAAAATDDIPEMLDFHATEIYGLYKMNMLYAYDDLETIDLSDENKWGNKNFIRYGNFDGKQYGTFTYDWEFFPAILGICAFDSTVLRSLNLGYTPHEMLEEGTWTWAEFEKLLELSTFTEGEKNVVGLGYESSSQLVQTVLFSNGVEFVTEENGTKEFALTSSESYAALDWVSGLCSDGIAAAKGVAKFNEHEMLFFVGESYYFTHMTQQCIDNGYPVYEHDGYGFITFPTGPNGVYGSGGSYITQQRRLNWLVEASDMDKDELGTALDLMFEPLTGTDEKAWLDFLTSNVFYYGNTDREMFLYMVENTKYDWSSPLGSVYSRITSAFDSVINGKSTPSEAMTALTEAVNTALNED